MGGEVIDSLQGQINLTSAFSSYLIKHAALHSLLKSDMGLEKEVLCYSIFFLQSKISPFICSFHFVHIFLYLHCLTGAVILRWIYPVLCKDNMPRAVSQNHISSSLSLNYTHPFHLLIILYRMTKLGLAGFL